MYQSSECDHAPSDRPDHLQKREHYLVVSVEEEKQSYDSELEKNQPHAPRQEELREFGFRFAAELLEVSPCASEKYEHRRAEVRDPACKEEKRICFRHVCRIEHLRVREVTRVIEHHDHHYQPAQQIYGIDSRLGTRRVRG